MSTEVTTEMMNEVIAVFDGWERYEDRYGIWFRKDELIKCLHPKLQELKYHTSWDWLMPTFHKVREKAVELKDDATLQRLYSKVMEQLLFGTIADVHLAIYNFITWLNQQKQTNETTGAL